MSDWGADGKHYYNVQRGCRVNNSTGIFETTTSIWEIRDAALSCQDSSCNGGVDVIDYYTQDLPSNVDSCHGCQFTQYLNGTIDGLSNCADYSESNVTVIQCPVYARNSCTYTNATVVLNSDDGTLPQNITNQIVRECSPFFTNRDAEVALGVANLTLTKKSCTTDKCNVDQPKETCRSVQVN